MTILSLNFLENDRHFDLYREIQANLLIVQILGDLNLIFDLFKHR